MVVADPARGLAAALTVCLMLSCTAEVTPASVWRVDDPELYTLARAAAEDWCTASNGRFCPVVMDSGWADGTIGWREARGPNQCGWHTATAIGLVPGAEHCPGYVADPGVCHSSEAVHPPAKTPDCWREATATERLQGTIAHELGHAGGIDHVDDKLALMLPSKWSVRPTAADVAALTEP